jgi:hypothetical protein
MIHHGTLLSNAALKGRFEGPGLAGPYISETTGGFSR